MNRKILFKSKRKDNGEWVEGLPGYDINGNITELEVYKKSAIAGFMRLIQTPSANTPDLPTRMVRRFGRMIL